MAAVPPPMRFGGEDMDHSPRITVRLPQTWLNRLDSLRGSEDLAVFVRSIIYASLGDSVPAYKERRGTTWDRIVVMNPANKSAELRRRARNEKRRQQPKRPKPVPPGPTFCFHPSGQVTSSDLDPLATFVGLIADRGEFLPESHRYPVDRVRQELLQQMESEPEREWSERYRLFLARTQR